MYKTLLGQNCADLFKISVPFLLKKHWISKNFSLKKFMEYRIIEAE